MTQAVYHHRGQIETANGLDILAGAWLLISPFILAMHATHVTANNVLLGIIICGLALVRFVEPAYRTVAFSWITALLGLWVLISPWALGFSTMHTAMTNNVAMGIIVFVLACWSALVSVSDHEADRSHNPPATL
jgi:hypothetical protein